MADERAPYDVGAVANYMIGRSLRKRRYMTHLKLQKLVYISYGFYRAITGHELFEQEIEAWPYGPVVPELYHEFKRFGRSPIKKWSADYDYETGKFDIPLVGDNDHITLVVLDLIWKLYEQFEAHELVDITHADGSPWKQTLDHDEKVITDDLIAEHYQKLLHGIVRKTARFRTA